LVERTGGMFVIMDMSGKVFDFIVYMNKTHQVYAMDAYKYIEDNGIPLREDSHNQVISETVFFSYLLSNPEYIEGKSFMFITKTYPEFDSGFKRNGK
jgi:hypothetical protein